MAAGRSNAMRFEGKTVAILGGNSGIGRAAAIGFAAEGARLAITGRDPGTLEKVAAETGAIPIRSDIASITDSQAAFDRIGERLGPVDVLCVNAGIGGFAPIAEAPNSGTRCMGSTSAGVSSRARRCFRTCETAVRSWSLA